MFMMINKRWILICLITTTVLVSCSSPSSTITPIITAPATSIAPNAGPSSGGVVASGVVVPARQANLGLALPARIQVVDVIEGDTVQEGQLLVQLTGQEGLEAAVAAAELNLLNAQQAADMALAQAKLEYANALDALDDAEREWTVNQEGNRATASGLKDAKADVTITEKMLAQARKNLDNADGRVAKAQAQSALTDAERAYNQAVWMLNWLQSEPTEIEQALLDAELSLAKARLGQAEQELERLEGNLDAPSLAELNLEAAEKGLSAARAALAESGIRAPFAGTVVSVLVNPGEAAVPGQILLIIADLDHFQVKTTDLSERDVAGVQVGSSAVVYVEALGEEIEGEIVNLSQQATTIGGDVVYTVTIDLPTHPENLLWGMSVEVEILPE
jgi:multidrug efflux pump subunit AcrA (membrane-fusion protein)